MNEEDKQMMESFGITTSTEIIYHFKRYQYRRLQDAINYARIYAQRMSKITKEPDPDEDKRSD